MTISDSLYSSRLQSLISQWKNLRNNEAFEDEEYYELYHRSKHILSKLNPNDDQFWETVAQPEDQNVSHLIGKLRATYLDLNDGLILFEYQIQDQMSVDLMEQAKQLIEGDERTDHSHIPAAVLSGAVLEHFLRTLCERQELPIPLTLENGNHKTLATLVNDLCDVDLYNAVEKKQLKAWVEIRNQAAHGNFDQFEPEQVQEMVEGIRAFIEKHQVER